MAQVEWQVQVMVPEGEVLGRVEYLEQSRRRIATKVGTEFVDLVQHHHWIVDAGSPQRLYDAPGQSANIGPAMAPELSLVMDTAKRHPFEFAAHRPRDGLAKTGLAHSG